MHHIKGTAFPPVFANHTHFRSSTTSLSNNPFRSNGHSSLYVMSQRTHPPPPQPTPQRKLLPTFHSKISFLTDITGQFRPSSRQAFGNCPRHCLHSRRLARGARPRLWRYLPQSPGCRHIRGVFQVQGGRQRRCCVR